jgi:hypothetical protein
MPKPFNSIPVITLIVCAIADVGASENATFFQVVAFSPTEKVTAVPK